MQRLGALRAAAAASAASTGTVATSLRGCVLVLRRSLPPAPVACTGIWWWVGCGPVSLNRTSLSHVDLHHLRPSCVQHIMIDRPGSRNAVDSSTARELTAAFEAFAANGWLGGC